jgi:glutamine synthetase type III
VRACVKKVSQKGYLQMNYRISSLPGSIPHEVCERAFYTAWDITSHAMKDYRDVSINIIININSLMLSI